MGVVTSSYTRKNIRDKIKGIIDVINVNEECDMQWNCVPPNNKGTNANRVYENRTC